MKKLKVSRFSTPTKVSRYRVLDEVSRFITEHKSFMC